MRAIEHHACMFLLLLAALAAGCGSSASVNLLVSGVPADTALTYVSVQIDATEERLLDGRRERVPISVRRDYAGRMMVKVEARNTAGCALASGAASADFQGEDMELPVALVAPDVDLCRKHNEVIVTREGAGTITSLPEGISCEPTCSAQLLEGTQVSLTATPVAGSQFLGWSGACEGTQPTCAVSMAAARQVTARFTPQRYALVLGRDGEGAVRSADGQIDCGSRCTYTEYEHGSRVDLSALPGDKLFFGGWSGDCQGMELRCQVLMTGPRTVRATFNPANLMFVTQQEYSIAQIQAQGTGSTPAERMISGGDRICNVAAAGLPSPGRYRAFLSSAAQGATARISSTGARGWLRRDERPFADEMVPGLAVLYPPRVSETKALQDVAVFTGSDWWGNHNMDSSCDNWSNTGDKFFFIGRSFNGTSRWPFDWGWHCNMNGHLYCFGTEFRARIPPQQLRPNHRMIFVSAGSFDPSAGIAAADQLCNSEAASARAAGKLPAGNSYRAVLSTTGVAAAARFPSDGAPYIHRQDGVLVANAYSLLFDGNLYSFPGLDAMGRHADAFPFTGAAKPNQMGTDATTCRNWQSRNEADNGHIGSALSAASSAFDVGDAKCSEPRPVYCLEQ